MYGVLGCISKMKKTILVGLGLVGFIWAIISFANAQEISEYRIAFASDVDGDWEIYLMDADGGNSVRLTHSRRSDYYPFWSPDGTKIAFFSNRDGNSEIYVMDADGGNQKRLTDNPATDKAPCWSPDGTRIAFNSNRDGNYEIYVMDVDGNNPMNLTNTPAYICSKREINNLLSS